jgi:hypothetical protein
MSENSRPRWFAGALAALGAVTLGTLGLTTAPVRAASHSDAPLIKLDPQANITDVYAYVRTRTIGGVTTRVLNVLVNVRPFSNSGDGVIYDKFSDDALYSIHITDPNTGQTLRRYDFRFSGPSDGLKNLDTILSYGRGAGLNVGPITGSSLTSPTRNYTQTYQVIRTIGNGAPTVIANNVVTPPPNVGGRTTPDYNDATGKAVSGKTTRDALDSYTREAIQDLGTGETIFAGSREDSFYADTAGIFDLLDGRIVADKNPNIPGFGQDGGGPDDFKGFNVLSYCIQIPLSDLPSIGYTPVFAGALGLGGATTGVGVYASVSRPRVTLRSTTGAPTSSGPFIQVNRMGNPLFNEVLVALRDKDNYNRTSPFPGGDSQFATYALNPEVAILINFAIFNSANPLTGPLVTTGRTDLQAVYIPDVLRVDTTTAPVPVPGEAGFNRLSFIGGDVVTSPNGARPAGWPNGRRQGDDVVDIALTAVASGPTYSAVTLVGDNAITNDQVYHTVFPYLATPHSGSNHSYDTAP